MKRNYLQRYSCQRPREVSSLVAGKDFLQILKHLTQLFCVFFLIFAHVEKAEATERRATHRTIFDLSLEEVMNIRVRATESVHHFRQRQPLSFLNHLTLEGLGVSSTSDLFSMIDGLDLRLLDQDTFVVQPQGALTRVEHLALFIRDRHGIRELNSEGLLSNLALPFSSIEKATIVRGDGAQLFTGQRRSLVVILDLREARTTLQEEGAL